MSTFWDTFEEGDLLCQNLFTLSATNHVLCKKIERSTPTAVDFVVYPS